MLEAVKKLTVSYGAFSCTLEGFDDPFPVMKMVVDYFQSLADRDPSFGAHPERPDADYLRNLAQRGTNHGVEVETQENGVILRQTFETMPETADALTPARGTTLSLVPRAESAGPQAFLAADLADQMVKSLELNVQATGKPTSADFARVNQPSAFGSAFTTDSPDSYDREERALERLLNAARMRSGTEETLAPANPMSRIKESLQHHMDAPVSEDSLLPQAMPDTDFVAEINAPERPEVAPEIDADTADAVVMAGFADAPITDSPQDDAESETDDAALATELIDETDQSADEHAVALADEIGADLAEPAAEQEDATQTAELAASAADTEGELLARFETDAAIETSETDEAPAFVVADAAVPAPALSSSDLETAKAGAPDPDIHSAEEEATYQSREPSEFDWKSEDSAAELEPISPPIAKPMGMLVLGRALRIVSGDEDQADSRQPATESVEQPVEEPRRQIHRGRPSTTDFDYDAAERHPAALDDDAPVLGERMVASSEDDDITESAYADGITLDNFARKVGAASLPELLEASAAYVTIVSGQPRFSRASILNMVDELSDERSYTQEARIKSFGKLLRNGSILRVEDGKFAISHSAKFNYEVKISA